MSSLAFAEPLGTLGADVGEFGHPIRLVHVHLWHTG